jgi:long-chain fatty acid transport protein
MKNLFLAFCCLLYFAGSALASGYGVFTQGASGLGQANAVVAHPIGPSSLYFNPALLNDVPGRQIEAGTSGIYSDRQIDLDSGGSEDGETGWNFPSTFYYTQEINERIAAGVGVFFPFGLSNEWDENYEGRYIGTSGEVLTINFNPAISWRVNNRLSIAGGFSLLYLDATLKNKVNQTAAYLIAQTQGAPLPSLPPGVELNDVGQKFEADGWGAGYNLGVLFKATDRVSIGAAYRSHIDVDAEGDVSFDRVNPLLSSLFPEGDGNADIRLPAQFTAGVAVQVLKPLIVEAGVRWEDWESTEELKIELDKPVLGQPENIIPRDWSATWTYNIGVQYRLNEKAVINAGYLYGNNAVPGKTFEPVIPDTDAHLFTAGTDLTFGVWTVSGAFGIEHHEERDKDNTIADPLGSLVAGQLVNTANGTYETDIYLVALSVGYHF